MTTADGSVSREESLALAVVVMRQPTANRWVDVRWSVVGLLPALPDRAAWSILEERGQETLFYAGTAEVTLHATETDNYRHNLAGPTPTIYVILRRDRSAPQGLRLLGVTVDPGEIDSHSDVGDDVIEALAMPPDIFAWVAGFNARHYVERPFFKRQRDRPDHEALGRRVPEAGFVRDRPGYDGGDDGR